MDVELTADEFSGLVDLLQLMGVMGVKLWMQGTYNPMPRSLASAIFDKLCHATLDTVVNKRSHILIRAAHKHG